MWGLEVKGKRQQSGGKWKSCEGFWRILGYEKKDFKNLNFYRKFTKNRPLFSHYLLQTVNLNLNLVQKFDDFLESFSWRLF